jgi:hypothetical protein
MPFGWPAPDRPSGRLGLAAFRAYFVCFSYYQLVMLFLNMPDRGTRLKMICLFSEYFFLFRLEMRFKTRFDLNMVILILKINQASRWVAKLDIRLQPGAYFMGVGGPWSPNFYSMQAARGRILYFSYKKFALGIKCMDLNNVKIRGPWTPRTPHEIRV